MDKIRIIFEELFNNFADAIPRFLGAIIIFIIGYIVARIVAFVVRKVLSTIGVDRIAEKLNEIEFIDKANVKIIPSKVLSKIFYYVVLLVFTIVSAEYLDVAAVTGLVRDILNYIPSLIAGLLVLVIGLLLAQFIQNILSTALKSLGVPSARIIATFVFYFVFLMAVITAMTQVGIDTDFISNNLSIIIAGCIFAFALGYGLASKDLMANFLASFYSKDKIKIGDFVTIDRLKGEVIKIDSTSITLLTKDSKIIIPLSKLNSESFEIHDA